MEHLAERRPSEGNRIRMANDRGPTVLPMSCPELLAPGSAPHEGPFTHWCNNRLTGSVSTIRYRCEWWRRYRPGPRRQPLSKGMHRSGNCAAKRAGHDRDRARGYAVGDRPMGPGRAAAAAKVDGRT